MRPKREFTTKHHIFGAKNLRQQENFTQPLVVMVETFRRSAINICTIRFKHDKVFLTEAIAIAIATIAGTNVNGYRNPENNNFVENKRKK